MTRKKSIGIIVLIIAVAVAWYGYKEYTRTPKDLFHAKADFVLSSAQLLHEYETNDSSANNRYNGKIIEVTGNIKKVEKDEQNFYTIVLGDSLSLNTIRCSMDTAHQQDAAVLVQGSSATMRGACTGYNKDEMGLGADVILNRCAVINKKD
ncbi:MAG TPA: hypothetical protein VF487_07865 [Chitinophagaceae bacterium]